MEDYTKPCDVTAFEGSVVIRGPGALVGAFTPDAAQATAEALLVAAEAARAYSGKP